MCPCDHSVDCRVNLKPSPRRNSSPVSVEGRSSSSVDVFPFSHFFLPRLFRAPGSSAHTSSRSPDHGSPCSQDSLCVIHRIVFFRFDIYDYVYSDIVVDSLFHISPDVPADTRSTTRTQDGWYTYESYGRRARSIRSPWIRTALRTWKLLKYLTD